MQTLFIVRHGRINEYLAKAGRLIDCPLSLDGLRDLSDIAQFLRQERVSKIVTTGRNRTDTIGFALAGPGIVHLIDWRLQEQKQDLRNELSWEDTVRRFPFAVNLGPDSDAMRFPTGENDDEVEKRVLDAWNDLQHDPAPRIAIVGHGSSNGWLLSHLLQSSKRIVQHNGTVFEFHCHDGTPMLVHNHMPIRALLHGSRLRGFFPRFRGFFVRLLRGTRS